MDQTEREERRKRLLAHVSSLVRHLQAVSDKSQKEASADAGIPPGTVGYWLREENPATIDKLDLYVGGHGAELILEIWHPKEDRRPIVTTQAGAEAAQAIDAMNEPQRTHVLRLLRDAPYMTKGDWRGLEGMLTAIEADIDITPPPKPRHPEP